MNATSLPTFPVEAAPFVALQREMHDALLSQNPEWVERDGNCPTCTTTIVVWQSYSTSPWLRTRSRALSK